MPNINPKVLFAGYEIKEANETVTAKSIVIPFSDLAGLIDAEADPDNGDGRELLRILIESAFIKITALDAAARPTRLTFNKAQSLPAAVNVNQIRQTYTLNFDVTFQPENISLVGE